MISQEDIITNIYVMSGCRVRLLIKSLLAALLRVFYFCTADCIHHLSLSVYTPQKTRTHMPVFNQLPSYQYAKHHSKSILGLLCHSDVCTNVKSGDVTGMVDCRSGMTTVRNLRAEETVLRHH